MGKFTWKEAVLDQIKLNLATEPFATRELSPFVPELLAATGSRAKAPMWTVDKVLKDLRDLKILTTPEQGRWRYNPENNTEDLVDRDKRSTGHIRVTKCLERLKIKYVEEKTFEDLKHKSFLRLDVYFEFLGVRAAVEYDGVQHAQAVDAWGGTEGLSTGRKRDLLKSEYCRDNNIRLLRIPHTVKDVEGEVYEFVKELAWGHIGRMLLVVFVSILTR